MNTGTQSLHLIGGAGTVEALRDDPVLVGGATARGVAVIAHPHPLFGGAMTNKVVQTLARAFVQCGLERGALQLPRRGRQRRST